MQVVLIRMFQIRLEETSFSNSPQNRDSALKKKQIELTQILGLYNRVLFLSSSYNFA